MDTNLWHISLAFLEGFALIISPCILPILPLILTGSLTGNKFRPIGIITGFICAFTLVTLFSKLFINLSHVSPDILQNISYFILFLLGVMMMSTFLTEKFSLLTQGLTHVGNSLHGINNTESGFFSGFLFGSLIGIIWTPCAGPILAAVIVQAVIQQTTIGSLLIVFAFGVGLGVPMLLIALLGRKAMTQFRFFRDKSILFRKLLGFLIIMGVIFAFYSAKLTLLSAQISNESSTPTAIINGLKNPYKAPAIAGIQAWINSPPLNLSNLKGKVVLIDFWTYSCINCIRTFPYLKNWYAKYRDKGFIIVGIHSPEFAFEHDLKNVKNAVAKFGLLYPVALDNQFVTWQNYANLYWPAHYLISKEGNVVYQHFGEGEYAATENNIRYLLGLKEMPDKIIAKKYSFAQTPEIYLGYMRSLHFATPKLMVRNKVSTYHYPPLLPQNSWALTGDWIIYNDKIVSVSPNAAIKLHFYAKEVYAVLGGNGKTINVRLLQENKQNFSKSLPITHHQLYDLIQQTETATGVIELIATTPGLEIYSFTFG